MKKTIEIKSYQNLISGRILENKEQYKLINTLILKKIHIAYFSYLFLYFQLNI